MSFWNKLSGGGGTPKSIQPKGEPPQGARERDTDQGDLCRAATDGDLYTVKRLIAQGVDLNGRDRYGDTALGGAVRYRQESIVSALLQAGANVNARSCWSDGRLGRTPLHEAADNDDAYMVRLLVAAGASLSAKDDIFTPLDWAGSMHPNAAGALRAAEGEPRNQNLLRWERLNLVRWERCGSPQQWVNDHHGQWNHSDWDALLEDLKRSDFWPMEPAEIGRVLEDRKSARPADRSDARPSSARPNSGSNWYFAEDKARCLRQVVLISDPKRAVKSRFSALALPGSFIELIREPLVTGLFPMSGYQENFLLVRTDRMVEEVATSSLQVAFSFFHLPTSGLVAIHVSCVPLKAKAKRGWLEQIYGLDSDLTRELVENAVKGEALHVIHAGEGGMRTKVIIVGGEETGNMDGPLCEFDLDIPYENDCRSVLAEEWNAVLRHHRSIRNPDFQAAGKRLYELMPEDAKPILPRFPFEQFEHAMIFVKGPATNFQLSDDVHLVLEEMTGRSIHEVSLKARPMHVVKNSGGVVDDVAKGTRQGLIAATELGLKLRDKELPMRVLNDSLEVVERFFRDPESGVEMAIFLFYGVRK